MREPPVWLILLAFPVLWVALSWILAQMFGWAKLARSLMAYHRPMGERYFARSMEFAPMGSYGNAINVILSAEGIHLKPLPIFAVGHPPIIIPWDAVTGVNENIVFKSVRGMQVQLQVEGKVLKLYLPSQARETIDRYTRNRFKLATIPAASQEAETLKAGRST